MKDKQIIKYLNRVRSEAISNPEYAFDLPWTLFIDRMRLLTPQSYGSRIQNKIFNVLGWQTVSANMNMGDVKNGLEQYFEVKVSIITPSNLSANFVQLRLWQRVDGYYLFVIETNKDNRPWSFFLSKNEMKHEVELIGQSAHGTQLANASNVNREYAIRLSWDRANEHFQRWKKSYLSPSLSRALRE